MGREKGDGFRTERIYVYLWLIHVDIWQKTAQHCKAIIIQLKINTLKSTSFSVNAFRIFAHPPGLLF